MADSSTSRASRRAQLLDVSLTLFGERGYHATSIADIIERADVARGTFYNYFESKRRIFEVLLDELFERVTASAFSILVDGSESIESQVRRNIANICTTLRDNLPMTRVLLQEAVGLDAEANAQLRAFYDRVLLRIETALADGQAMGIVRAGNTAVLATCLLGMMKETLYQHALGTRTLDLDAVVREIYEVAVGGILVSAAELRAATVLSAAEGRAASADTRRPPAPRRPRARATPRSG